MRVRGVHLRSLQYELSYGDSVRKLQHVREVKENVEENAINELCYTIWQKPHIDGRVYGFADEIWRSPIATFL